MLRRVKSGHSPENTCDLNQCPIKRQCGMMALSMLASSPVIIAHRKHASANTSTRKIILRTITVPYSYSYHEYDGYSSRGQRFQARGYLIPGVLYPWLFRRARATCVCCLLYEYSYEYWRRKYDAVDTVLVRVLVSYELLHSARNMCLLSTVRVLVRVLAPEVQCRRYGTRTSTRTSYSRRVTSTVR